METGRTSGLFVLFRRDEQMHFIFSNNLPSNVETTIIAAKLSKKSRNKRRSNRFFMVSSFKSAFILLQFLIVTQNESGTRKTISWSVTVFPIVNFPLLSSNVYYTAIYPCQCLICLKLVHYVNLTLYKGHLPLVMISIYFRLES